jgi:hypothetical protein
MWTEAAREAAAQARQVNAIAHQTGVNNVGKVADGTYDQFGHSPQSGYMVGGAAGGRYTGAWTDPATGKLYVEKSTRVNSPALAKSLGRMRNQISVWDLKRSREIKTGGNGVWSPR